jgi:RNA polymerase sigma factor (sigma-70 family)
MVLYNYEGSKGEFNMKKDELKSRFNDFYKKTYPDAMRYCMSKTGDFLNSEDLLADVYYEVYKRFIKDKNGEIREPERYLYTALKNRVSKYWNKDCKESLRLVEIGDETDFEEFLSTELELTEETAMKQMLVQDILEYVSECPLPQRRAFAMHFYLGMSLNEVSKELDVPITSVRNYIYRLLKEIRENFLEEYE